MEEVRSRAPIHISVYTPLIYANQCIATVRCFARNEWRANWPIYSRKTHNGKSRVNSKTPTLSCDLWTDFNWRR